MWVLGQKWDNLRVQFQVGSRGSQVKQVVNYHSLVGGGLGEPKLRPRGPLWWAVATTKVVVVE